MMYDKVQKKIAHIEVKTEINHILRFVQFCDYGKTNNTYLFICKKLETFTQPILPSRQLFRE